MNANRWPVALGLLGSVLVAVGALSARFVAREFLAMPAWGALAALPDVAGRLLLAAGIVVVAVAFALLDPRHRRVDARRVAALWYLPLLLVPPVVSRDMYAYVDQGWMALHVDPYTTGMGTVGPFTHLVDDFWRGTTTVYPPLALLVQASVVVISSGSVVAAVLLMRLPVVASLAVIAWLAPVVARRITGGAADAGRVRWIALLNPITVVHLVGGGHNDAVMIALVVAAVALATTRQGFWTGSVVAGLAMAAKQPGLLAAVAVALVAAPAATLVRRVGAAVAAVVVALATFALVSVATYGFGWLTGDGAPTTVETQSPACLASLVASAATGIGYPSAYAVALPLALAALGVVLLALWLGRWREPVAFLALALLAFAALGPGLQPWYLAYGLVVAAAARLSSRAWVLVWAWAAQVCVGNYLAEAWGMLTLHTFAWSLPAALVTGAAAWWWQRGPRLSGAGVEG